MNKDILRLLNERQIAYYPIYKELTGSTPGGVVLSQLMYWFAKKDKFYKTDKEIIKETKIGVGELKSVKKQLKALEFLEITREGVPAKTYYKIDWEAYEHSLVKLTKQEETNSPNCIGQIDQSITKITTKKERGGKFYKQNEQAIKLYIDEVIKQEKEIRSVQGYKKALIDKFIKEDAATIETFTQWREKYNANALLQGCKGLKYTETVEGKTSEYILEDIKCTTSEYVVILQQRHKNGIANLRVPFQNFEDMRIYLTTRGKKCNSQ